uniref:Translin associated factor X n=1 Tax=Equus caballus TaxID=9796 RepID=A0A9L0T4K4_HORSE
MSNKEGSGGFRKRKHDNFPHNQRREGKDVNSSSPVMLAFKSFQQELDARHDKYERLVKLSRDITVESKRTIFLLHRITSLVGGAGPMAEWLSLRTPLQAAQCFVGLNPGCGHGTAHQTTPRQHPTCHN